MRPAPFELARADAVARALELVSGSDDAHFYAGGTELLLAMKLRVIQPERLVDIKRIPGLDTIAMVEGRLVIGARARHAQIEADPLVRRYLPALATLCSNVANVRVRGTGTIGGNICFGEPHADPPTMLAALNAQLHLTGPEGDRVVAADDFIVGEFETVREPSELLTRIEIRVPTGPVAYRRFRHGERPSVNAAVVLDLSIDRRTVTRARVRVGALGPRPQRLAGVESELTGAPLLQGAELLAGSLPDALEALEVVEDRHGRADYKRHVAGVLVSRCFAGAVGSVHAEGGRA